jgi:ParB family transcriptional regulator, chromosome partitioning protein
LDIYMQKTKSDSMSIRSGLSVLREMASGASESAVPIRELPIEKIVSGICQPRKYFNENELSELTASIKAQGIIQPILVRPITDELKQYEIIAGERRWRAAQMVGLTKVPVVVKNIDDKMTAVFALIENIQRTDLNPIEEAEAIRRLVDEFGLTQEEVALQLGKPRSTITNLLRILTLKPEIRRLIGLDALSLGHAKVLLGAEEQMREIFATKTVKEGLSVRKLEMLINATPVKQWPLPVATTADLSMFEQDRKNIERQLGLRIKFKINDNYNGKIEFAVKDIADIRTLLGSFREKQ